jgi:p-aminobenzoyl-glutamate transporter AbgT
MRRFPTSVAVFACFCLLALQLSGLHLHVDIGSEQAESHGTHMHQFSSAGDNHAGEVDVQLLEQFAGQWSKIVAQVCYVFLLIVAAWIFRPTWSHPLSFGKVNRRLYWRPLLRAPPLHS